MTSRPLQTDSWTRLRRHTAARIALGRAGTSLPTQELLGFALDHAEARDAVYSELDESAMAMELSGFKTVLRVRSQIADRAHYLKHPDLGRRLAPESAEQLNAYARDAHANNDIVIILGDGLSATATQRHGAALAAELKALLAANGYSIGPAVIARYARVGLQDPIGQALGARLAVMLLGERPGLGSADSLGAYLVFAPRPGLTDADRNCVSNIRPAGLALPVAAQTLLYLISQSLQRRISGVQLKDDRPLASLSPLTTPPTTIT